MRQEIWKKRVEAARLGITPEEYDERWRLNHELIRGDITAEGRARLEELEKKAGMRR